MIKEKKKREKKGKKKKEPQGSIFLQWSNQHLLTKVLSFLWQYANFQLSLKSYLHQNNFKTQDKKNCTAQRAPYHPDAQTITKMRSSLGLLTFNM